MDRRGQQRAWYVYDWANSAYVTTTATVLFGPYLTVVAKRAACPGQDPTLRCAHRPGRARRAGQPRLAGPVRRHRATCSPRWCCRWSARSPTAPGASARCWPGSPGSARPPPPRWSSSPATNWQLGVLLLLVASLCLGSSLVVYDAILCEIAAPDERDRVSSRGWALGYLGGGLLLAVNLAAGHRARRAGAVHRGGRCGSACSPPGSGGRLFTADPLPRAARPDRRRPGRDRGAGRRLGGQRSASSRRHAAAPARVPADPAVPAGLPVLQRRHPDRDRRRPASTAQSSSGFDTSQLITTILLVQFVAFGGALLFGRLAAAGRRPARRAGQPGAVVPSWSRSAYFLPAGEFAPFLLLGGPDRARARRHPGAVPVAVQPAGAARPRGGVLQPLPGLRAGTSWFGTLLFGLVLQLTDSYRLAILALVVFFVVGGDPAGPGGRPRGASARPGTPCRRWSEPVPRAPAAAGRRTGQPSRISTRHGTAGAPWALCPDE